MSATDRKDVYLRRDMANGAPEKPIVSPCLLGNDNQRRISTVERDCRDVEQRMETGIRDVWTAISELREHLDRLPVWGALMMTGLGAIAGAAVAAAVAAIV